MTKNQVLLLMGTVRISKYFNAMANTKIGLMFKICCSTNGF